MASVLDFNHPINHGTITNWQNMECLLNYLFFNLIKVDPSEHPLFMAGEPFNCESECEKMMAIMFETFSVPSFLTLSTPILSLFNAGCTNGVVINSGDGTTTVDSIIDCFSKTSVHSSLDIAGGDLTDWLVNSLFDRGFKLLAPAEKEIVRNIKETKCFTSLDFHADLAKSLSSRELDQIYELPDSMLSTIGNECFKCPEILFNPSIAQINQDGIHKMVNKIIMKNDEDLRKMLYENIILAGGTTMFPNFAERVENEVRALAPPFTTVNVIAQDDRLCATWRGGSIISSFETFPKMVITRNEYDEFGPDIAKSKCQLNN